MPALHNQDNLQSDHELQYQQIIRGIFSEEGGREERRRKGRGKGREGLREASPGLSPPSPYPCLQSGHAAQGRGEGEAEEEEEETKEDEEDEDEAEQMLNRLCGGSGSLFRCGP